MSVAVTGPTTALPHGTVETRRGTHAMLLFIATEATLFLCLFFAYFYLGHQQPRWPPEPPKLTFALVMLAVLISSSLVLHWGERQLEAVRHARARLAVGVTIALGLGFLLIQGMEYREKLKHLQPTSNAYGSIFYAITSLHAAHLVLGMLMLTYVLILPEIGPARRPPHRALHNVSLYWHFIDAVWVVIVGLLYVMPYVIR